MTQENPTRREFFRSLFEKSGVKTVLDCACGTGGNLRMFRAMGFDVTGSDISDSMLVEARKKIGDTGVLIRKVDSGWKQRGGNARLTLERYLPVILTMSPRNQLSL